MERSEVFCILEKYLKSKMKAECELNDNSVLSQIGISSVEFVLLLVFVENELDIIFEDEDLLITNDVTIGELIDRILHLHDVQGC